MCIRDRAGATRLSINSTGQVQIQQNASDLSGASALKVTGTAYGTNKTIEAYMSTASATKSLIYAENSSGSVFNVRGDGLATFSGGITVSGGITSIGSSTELTVSGGSVTVTKSFHTIDTQNNDATDSLSTINGGVDGAILVLRSQSSDRDTNIKDGIGNLRLAGDFNLLSTQKMLTLIKVGSNWYELSRSDNG